MEGESMSEWKEVKLGDIVDINKSTYSIKDKWDYLSYLDTGNITKGVIDNIQVYEDIDTIPSRARRKVMKNDIIYSCVRPNQRHYGFISEPIDNLLVSTGFATISTKPEKANAKYLYYFLTQNEIVEYLQNIGEQAVSTYPTIKPSDISNIEIKIPSIQIQSEIAGILSSLDAKIETNNKLNEKLEEMAQAIFKSWFVDFEPFKDMPFHETEIGYIPQIFASGVLGDLCTFKRGKGLLSKDAIHGEVPVIAGGMKPACYHNIANTKAPVVTVSGSGANAGYTQIHNVDVWASDCSFIDSDCENLYYAYCFLSRRPKLLKHSQTGAAQPHVKPADIHRFQVVIPTNDVINEFQQIVKPLFDRIGMNKKENDRLASLRDTLLPRLMSGELIV